VIRQEHFGCDNSDDSVPFVAPFDSESSAVQEWIALCVINNTDTVQGGAVALIAKVTVPAVHQQFQPM